MAILRAEAGRNPYDRRLSDLIGELSTRSDEFRIRWAAHNVKFHRTGSKQLHHPVVGDLTLGYEALELPADHGQRILVYTAEPASPSNDALKLLATWSAITPLEEPHADAARCISPGRRHPARLRDLDLGFGFGCDCPHLAGDDPRLVRAGYRLALGL